MHSLVTKFNFSNRNNYMEVFLEPDLPELAASCNQRTSSQAPRSLYETSCTPQEYHSQYQDHGGVRKQKSATPMSDSGVKG
jgi:superfamily I DNA and RNA helicase